ncbi:MAG: ornithine cyclodeaminase family protein [Nanoarchaeota archaeon]|nr:ornithine cyclodeaminase family protein [Nanoarchaeota archaeon]
MVELTYLTQEDLVEVGLLDFKRALREVKQGLVWHSTGKSVSGKIALVIDPLEEWKFNAMSAVNGDYSAVKWLGSRTTNKREGLPRTLAMIILSQKETGIPLAVMEGSAISAIRTGCYSALALEYLCHPTKNEIGIIGSGVMAKASLAAMAQNFPERIGNVFVYSKNPANRTAFAEETSERFGIEVSAVDDVRKLVRGSDLTISAITKDDELLVYDSDAKTGATHLHIGGWAIEEKYVVRCANEGKVYCDDWGAIKSRNAHPLPRAYDKGLITEDQIYGDIGDVINGTVAGREGMEPIHFDTVGLGEMDLVLAAGLYEEAMKKNKGVKLDLWSEEPVWLLRGY